MVLVLEEVRGGFWGAEVVERVCVVVLVLLLAVEADKEAAELDTSSSKSLLSDFLVLLLLPRRFSGEVEEVDKEAEGGRAASMSEFLRRNRLIILLGRGGIVEWRGLPVGRV